MSSILCVMPSYGPSDKPLRASQAAIRLGVSTSIIRQWADDGVFPNAYRIGSRGDLRIPPADVEAAKQPLNHEPQQPPASGQEVSPAGESEPGSQDGGAAAHTPPGSLPEAQRA